MENNVISVSSREQVKVEPDSRNHLQQVYSQASDVRYATQNNSDLDKVLTMLKEQGVEGKINPDIQLWNESDLQLGRRKDGQRIWQMTTQVTVSDIPIDQGRGSLSQNPWMPA